MSIATIFPVFSTRNLPFFPTQKTETRPALNGRRCAKIPATSPRRPPGQARDGGEHQVMFESLMMIHDDHDSCDSCAYIYKYVIV